MKPSAAEGDTVKRYLRLLVVQLQASLLVTLQYRVELALSLFMACLWTVSALLPLTVLYGARQQFAGWTLPEALLVVGWFNVLKGIQGSLVQPSMQQAVLHIRRGTLDFVLLKPADAQFLVSTARFDMQALSDIAVGLGILAYAISGLDALPSATGVFFSFVVLGAGACILYAIWVLVMSLAFVFVKVDNLTYLFSSLFDAARFPGTIFRGVLAIIFTFVLPLIVMTTYPALALRDRLPLSSVGIAVSMAAVALVASRLLWRRSIRNYTSFGG